MKQKHIVMAVGGTGGHIYPAVALADQLKNENYELEILFLGGKLSTNPYFNRSGYNWKEISCSPINFKNPLRLISQFYKLLQGVFESRKILNDADLVIGFGSYYALPALLAAKWRKVPIFLHEQNSIPGRVNRLLSSFAVITGTHFPNTPSLLSGHCVEVGMPLRTGYKKGSLTQTEARKYFNLHENLPTLLVFGGSQGAQAMNEKVMEALKRLNSNSLQIIHLIGAKNDVHYFERRYQELGIICCVKEFENRMDIAWQAADAIISRSGAGTIAEQIEFEVPGILIPYPYAMDNHQEKNADFMVKTIGGAVKICECDLDAARLAMGINQLMDKDNLQKMSGAIRKYKEKKSHPSFVDIIINFLKKIEGANL